ncbi:MAG: hypothetical protein WCO84_00305 [bacterium]
MDSYLADKIKILEMICASLPPINVIENDDIELSYFEDEFVFEGLSYNTAINLLREVLGKGLINNFNPNIFENNKRGIKFTVGRDIEIYLRKIKYPGYEDGLLGAYMEHQIFDNEVPKGVLKTPIIINDKKGIYRLDKPELFYGVKNPSKRFDLIIYLSCKDKVSVSELAKETKQGQAVIMKEIKNINSIFRKKLAVVSDLIKHIETSGYSLNKDDFDIKIQT